MLAASDPIPRKRSLSVGDFRRDYVARSRPVILEGAAADWMALSRWTPQHLREQYGGQEVPTLAQSEDGDSDFDPRTGLIPGAMALREFLDQFESEAPPRMRVHCILGQQLPSLANDLEVLPHARHGTPVELHLWISGQRTRSRLHYDHPNNLLAQVRGTKRVLVVPRRQRRLVYPYPPWSANPHFSRVDLDHPDYARFPRLRRVRALGGVIRPGDAIFIPGRAWHYVEADEPTISVGMRWWPWSWLPLLALSSLYKRVRGLAR